MAEIVDSEIINNEKLNEENIDIILSEINEFFHIYLFKGYIAPSNIEIENLFNLTEDDLKILKIVHFLLSDEIKELFNALPNLIRNLSHSTKKEIEENYGNVKGKILWNQTIKKRFSRGFDDKTLFVCQPPSKYYDLEENQLLKFLLNRILYLKKEYLDFYNLNTELNLEKISETSNWQDIIDKLYHFSKLLLKKVYFDEITTINKVTSKHLRKTFKNRNPLYHKIAKAYILYEDLFILNDSELLKQLLKQRVIKTLDENKLYELYVLFNLIKALPESKEVRLLHSNNDYVVKYYLNDFEVKLYYQKIPMVLKSESKYLQILDNYNINKSVKSPDIILEFIRDGNTYYRLIEVKNSSEKEYVRNSLYKVMGYFKDFKGINSQNFVDNYPAVLVMWGGISLKENYNPFNDDIIILNRLEFLNYVENLLMFD